MNGAKKVAGLLFSLLLSGAFLTLANKASVWHATLAVTVLHVLSALLLGVLIARFLREHIAQKRANDRHGFGKILQFVLLLLVYASGATLIVVGRRGWWPPLHLVIGIGFIVSLLVHAGASRKRFALGALAEGAKIGGPIVFAGLMLSAGLALSLSSEASANKKSRTIENAFMQVSEELPPYRIEAMSPGSCARCHADIVRQWKQSLHAVADSEIIYARAVSEFREKHGVAASNWCAACHSPLRIARDQLNKKVADVDQPNVDCTVCHSIAAVHQPPGDNRFTLNLKPEPGYKTELWQGVSDRLLLIQPAAHQSRWNSLVTKSPEFCGACHTQSSPPFLAEQVHRLVLQDTYGEWARSRFNSADPAVRKTCQDCHMQPTNNRWEPLGEKIPNHYLAGGSVDVARLSGMRERLTLATELLSKTASLSIDVNRCSTDDVGLLVRVTNYGAGHNLPTGVTDLREVWLEVTVVDEKGEVFYGSGNLDHEGHLDDAAVRFGVKLGDQDKNPVRFHDIAKARYILEDTTIPAGTARDVYYSVPLHGRTQGIVKVRLLYRSVPQDFINHYMTADLRFQAVTMASTSLTFYARTGCRGES